MGVSFIVGRAGTGKTHYCITSIAQRAKEDPMGPPLVMLVPDQATFQVERQLLACGLPCFSRVRVFSFRRLASHILSLEGGGINPPVEELGKQMLLRRIVNQRLPELKAFQRVGRYPGFAKYLAGLLTELCNWDISLEDLKQLPAAGTYLDQKLHDVVLLYEDYLKYLEQGYFDPDTALDLLAEACSASFVRQAEFWLDGFSGFTPQEYKVLAALMRHAKEVRICLCLEPQLLHSIPWETNPFYPVWNTYQRCRRLAQEQGVAISLGPIFPRPRRFRNPALLHLEENFVAPNGRAYQGEVSGIEVVAAADRRHEVEIVARRIVQLVQGGMRYRQIGVILRDFGPYGELVHDIFTDYGIPHFLDRRRPVTHHPLAELVRAALEMAQDCIAPDPLFRLLKTDLTTIPMDEIDLLDRYCMEAQPERGQWERPWRDPVLDGIRKKVLQLVEPLCQALGQPKTVRERTEILYRWLVDLEVPDRLARWSQGAAAQGDLLNAKTHLGVWDVFVDVMEQMVQVLGEEYLDLAEYAVIMEAGLEQMQQGLIPLGLDQVLVGSVERSRQPELEAVFVLGLCDGEFPRCKELDSLINDDDRSQLAKLGVEFGHTLSERLILEQYFAYIALTRSSRFLHLSYAQNDDQARFLRPSRIIDRLCLLFPKLTLKEVVRPESSAFTGQGQFYLDRLRESVNLQEVVVNLTGALATLRQTGQAVPNPLRGLYHRLRKSYGEVVAYVLSSLTADPRPQPLIGAVARELYAPVASVTQAEAFAACPFRHFLQYGLGIRPLDERRLTPLHRGVVFHEALSSYGRRLQSLGLTWREVEPEQAEKLVREIVGELMERLAQEVRLAAPTLTYYGRTLEKTLQWAVSVLTRHDQLGRFRPVAYEQRFGYRGSWPGLELEVDGQTIVLRGSIDRIDVCRERGLVRVIDYKSSGKKLELDKVYHGLALQLMVYMLVVLEQYPHLRPAGVLCFPITDRFVSADGPLSAEEALQKRIKQVAMTGLLLKDVEAIQLMDPVEQGYSQLLQGVQVKKDGTLREAGHLYEGDQFQRLAQWVRGKLVKSVEKWLQGEVAVAPYRLKKETPCGYCDYPSVCCFEPNVGGFAYRELKSFSDQQVWELIQDDTSTMD